MAPACMLRTGALALLLTLAALACAPARAASPRAALPAAATLTLNTTLLDAAGDWLTVTWQHVPTPNGSDFLALMPEGARPGATSPLKIRPTNATSAGSASFRMLNWRTPHRWQLYRGGLAAPVLLASSPPLRWRNPNEPAGAHLSLTGIPTEMRVQWTTRNETQPVVYWGDESGLYTRQQAAETTQLLRSDVCSDAQVHWRPSRPNELTSNATHMGWLHPGVQHNALLAGLQPGARYFYALGDAAGPALGGREWSFVAPPAASASATLRFLVAADMGVAEVDGSNWDDTRRLVAPLVELSLRGWDNKPAKNTTARLTEEVLDGGAALMLLNGDISYARGFSAIWESFLDAMQPVAARVPLMTVPGNHESNWPGAGSAWNTSSLDSGGECGAVYSHRFPMPPPASRDAPWYSFDAGPVHFVALSTEHALSRASPQLTWLAADLAAADAARWKVLSAHRFFYIDSSTAGRDSASGRALLDDGLEELLLRFGVDVTLTGHHHSYQRTCPAYNGTCVPLRPDGSAAAPVHIVTGHAGAGISGVSGGSKVVKRVCLEHGYLSGSVNETHLVLTSRRSADGGTLDEVTLFKPAGANYK